MKTFLTTLLFLCPAVALTQNQLLEELPTMLQKELKITPQKSLSHERDLASPGHPLKLRCDIYTFLLTRKEYERDFPRLQDCFDAAGRDANCYSVNTNNGLSGDQGKRSLMVGDDPNRYVTIGESYANYVNVNLLDPADSTRTHRYAYALEWEERTDGSVTCRYVVTYARIPSAQTTIHQYRATIGKLTDDWDFSMDDMLLDDDIPLVFSRLKQRFQSGHDRTLAAVSIYFLCQRARRSGFYSGADKKEELDQLRQEVRALQKKAAGTATAHYFNLALEELEKIGGK